MSTTALQQIAAAANWHLRVNENFVSVSPSALYGVNPATTTGLTLGYLGGEFNGTTPANGTVVLTASTTNYVVAHLTTGVVTTATTTTNWLNTATYMRLYQVVTGASTITTITDKRQAFGAPSPSGTVAGSDKQIQYNASGAFGSEAAFAYDYTTNTLTVDKITLNGLLLTLASATGGAGLNIPHGAAPTAPANGDVWTTTAGMYARINGGTVGPFAPAGGSVAWGSITGTLASQTDLQAALDLKQARSPNVQSVASSATVTPTFSNDMVKVTAQAAALALANPTGTAIDGLGIVIRIKDNGTARAISYGTQYRAVGVTLPTTTVISKTVYLAMIYNNDDTKWDVVAVGQEA